MKALRITVSALVLALFAAVMLVAFFAACLAARESERPPLVFSEDGKFTVLHLTDFHEWLGVEGEGLLNVARRDGLKPLLEDFIVSSLDSVDPDLVVLGGDNVFPLSFWYDIGENSISLATYRAIAEVFEARSQYWTLTFGNHDSESFMNKTDFLDVLEEYSYFIGGTESDKWYDAKIFPAAESDAIPGADDYAGNFSIPIYDNSGTQILYNVFVLDTGSYVLSASAPYLSITEEQTEWYLERSLALEAAASDIVPAVMFTHIPFIEMREAYEEYGAADGSIVSGFSLSDTRSPIFEALLERGDVRGIFFGHEHVEDATVIYSRDGKSVMMGLTKMAQAASYSDLSSVMGGRVITLEADGGLSTYVFDSTGYIGATVSSDR